MVAEVISRHFGVLLPSTNTTVELEYTRLLPATLLAHYARLGKDSPTPFRPSRDEDLIYQTQLLANAHVEVIALTQTSASMFDDGYDTFVAQTIAAHSGISPVISAQAIGQALRTLKASRIALISPYSQEVMARTKRYYETRYDIEVLATDAFGATDSYAIGALTPAHATEAFARVNHVDIDAFVLPGGNFPTMRFIAEWEQQWGKAILTTNQAVVWATMRALDMEPSIPGLGTLLATPTAR
ncbi:MAG: hypothetical protein K0U93_30640 [Gammaproteobacteria bacterium]|nr:hypothetical protein [Gammaproteobacteria bacterium]